MSPFVVSSDGDTGYASRETLAGTRFKSDLQDVSAQVSVMTKALLDDLAAASLEDAYRYSINVENQQEYSNAKDTGNDPALLTRARGLAAPGVTHDFFVSYVPQDTYNFERVNFSSGPNSILFGNGNPAGIVDVALNRANLTRASYSATLRRNNYGSGRQSIDLNQPLIKQRLAVRFDALFDDTKGWRRPTAVEDRRYYGAIAAKPFTSTTVRAYFEKLDLDRTLARNIRTLDLVTPWINAGRPAFNNGLNSPTLINTANRGIFARNTTTTPVYILGATASTSDPYVSWGSGSSANINLPTTAYSAVTIGPGTSPNQTGSDSYTYSLPHDETVSPFNVTVEGNTKRDVTTAQIFGASIEQRLPGDLYLEIDYNTERMDRVASNPLSSAGLRADPNVYLPDRITPNPNLGRYYVDLGANTAYYWRKQTEEARIMLSYDVDVTKRSDWLRWLGRHRFAGMWSSSEIFSANQGMSAKLIPSTLTTVDAITNAYNTLTTPAGRYYLSDPLQPATGKTFYVTLPWDTAGKVTDYTLPDGSRYNIGWRTPYGSSAKGNGINSLTQSRLLAMQNIFLRGRLVLNVGLRKDNVRSAPWVPTNLTASSTSGYLPTWARKPPTNWSVFTQGNTETFGAVLHLLRGVSVFYNQSNTWNPPRSSFDPLTGAAIEGSTGKGKDYGVMLRLWDNRVSFRLNKYHNSTGPDSAVTYRTLIMPAIQNIELTLAQAQTDGRVTTPIPEPFHFDPAVGGEFFSHQVSRGYEAELTFNPIKNWRLTLNGSHATAVQSDIASNWINFIQARSPIWAQYGDLQGPNTGTTTIQTYYLGIIQNLNLIKQVEGQSVDQGRNWRANLFTRYDFTSGRLKGVFVGGGYRWRARSVIGYRYAYVDNAFPLPGAPAQLNVPALDSPIYGKAMEEAEALVGYTRKLNKKITWRVQLNIRNLLDSQRLTAQRANYGSGFVTNYDIPEPRSYVLTNTFSF
ncbi:TonB-dependent receptor [Opitutus sp. ER46]|uniref:TonB-dependent receptor n=1 Tax=Opitutus sp. ER46 TaxID=2161864 RepID=UPI001304A957|nr:TonB-dependent receptor [Opitutus sp. ER46]